VTILVTMAANKKLLPTSKILQKRDLVTACYTPSLQKKQKKERSKTLAVYMFVGCDDILQNLIPQSVVT